MTQVHPAAEARRRRPGEVLRRMPAEARRKRYFPALALFLLNYSAYAALLAGVVLLPGWPLKGLCALAASGVIGRLFVLGHDAGHDSLTPSRRWNHFLGRLAFLTTYTPLTSWMHAHNYLHHVFLRVRGKDMVWQPWGLEEYRAKPLWRRLWYRFLRTPAGISFYWIVEVWIRHHLFPCREGLRRKWGAFQRDRLLVLAFAAAQFAALWGASEAARGSEWLEPLPWWAVGPAAMVLPYWLWCFGVAVVDLIHHTHPRMVWFAGSEEWSYYQANVQCTTHIRLPFGLDWSLYNILLHTAHHVDPRIPLYHLPGAQRQLETAFPDEVVVEWLTPWFVWKLFRVCQLYDFERHCWLDYAGRPTSEPLPVAGRDGAAAASAAGVE
jgi:omega-6 fatty acid desaturase (delta-12 desaturase)